ncbi:hypothetical protein ATKI12_0034 [Kitasatospora sp. Ki12]
MNGGALNAPAVIVAALLVHQVSRTWEEGLRSLRHNYAPVFAVRLPGWATAACQLLALPVALAAALWDGAPWTRWVCAASVLLWMLGVQRRLANHAWLGGVCAVAFAFVPHHLVPVVARDLLVGVYLSATLFKLHGEYLLSSRSAGRAVLSFYCRLLGVRPTRLQLRWTPAGVVLIELAVGVLLCVPDGVVPALVLAVAMHAAFGVSGNFPFSIVALALWSLVMSPVSGALALPAAADPAWWAVPVFGVLALALGRTAAGPRSLGLMAKDVLQGLVYGVVCAASLAWPQPPSAGGGNVTAVHGVVGGLFLLNAGLVVTGWKLDWSFAMFSSLRPFGRSWLQRGGRGDWPRYYVLTLPERLPKALLRSVPAGFLYRSTRGTHAVHEAVVRRLEDLAGQHGLSFRPRQVVPSEDFSRLVPSAGQAPPRRAALLFPVIIPNDFSQHHLG